MIDFNQSFSNRKRGGNGLGLSIAKRLIEIYHGSLEVESVVGSGTVFKIELPLVQEKTDENDDEKEASKKSEI